MEDSRKIKQDVNVQLAQLQRDYIAKLPVKIAPINQDWQSLQLAGNDTEIISSMQRKLHAISGTSATLGVRQVSAITSEIEKLLACDTLNEARQQEIAEHMQSLNLLVDSNTLEATPMDFK